MEISLPGWECPKKACHTLNPIKNFKCSNCGFDAFIDIVLKNALWLTLFKFSIDVFLINVLNADRSSDYMQISALIDSIFLTFFGIINAVHITLKFDRNLSVLRSLSVGLITAVVIIIFYLLVTNSYNMFMSLAMASFEYSFELNANIIYPLIFCTLGGLIGGIYSSKIFKPVSKDIIDLNKLEEASQ